MVAKAASFLKKGDEIAKRMEVVGEEGTSLEDLIIYLKAELYDFSYLQQNAFDKEDAYCPLDRQIPLFQLINTIFDSHFIFHSHDEAREFFLQLQNQIKNLNFIPFDSHAYQQALLKITEAVEMAPQT